jgi:hypothetical protein
MVMAADWWNPATWLQNVAGFFHGAYDAGGAVLNVLGSTLTILTQFFRFFFDTGHFIADAVNWLTARLFPPELQTWFLGTIGQPGQQWNSAQIYGSLYRGMIPPALVIAAVAAAGRIMRALLDHRTGSTETILSVLPRFLLAVAVIGVPGTQISLGYTAMVWCVDASIAISGAVVGLIFQASLVSGFQAGQGWFTHLFGVLAAASGNMVLVVVAGIPLLILVLYAAFLMIVRTVMLGFCVVTAPLSLATAVFDANNRFFHWWLDLFGSVLLTPLVLGIAIALSLALASHVTTAFAVGPLLAVVICAGVRDMIVALTADHVLPRPVHASTPALACFPEAREASEYSRTEIGLMVAHLRSRYPLIVVDMSNRLPDPTAGPEAAAAAYWLEHADVLVLPSAGSKQDFNGVLDYLDVRDLPPAIVASLVPRSRRNREHPLAKRYMTAIAQRVYKVVDIPDDAERVRYAGMQGVPVEAVSASLRAAYRELAEAIVLAPQPVTR